MTDSELPQMDWTVIGAGPAGIAAVGKLIDNGIPPEKIAWMDPHFNVGDLGGKWQSASSNTKVQLFLDFLYGSKAFQFSKRPQKFKIEQLPTNDTCLLQEIVAPLKWVSDNLKTRVAAISETAIALNFNDGKWEIKTEQQLLRSQNVILATGAEPKTLSHPTAQVISLETALNPQKLAEAINPEDVIGVYGSSHSAILAMAHLAELNPKKMINFYRSPLKYAIYLENWILYDDTGIKGFTARWAKQNLEKTPPPFLERMLITDPRCDEYAALCTKVIYGVGFEKRKLPVFEPFGHLNYDDTTGIIAPGLYGLGIAFPQAKMNPLGSIEYRVGLWKFMDYLNSLMPIWIKYSSGS